MHRANVPNNFTSGNTLPSLLVWTTEEQKQKFLVPILTAEKTCWNKLTEPNGGADLANVQGTAVRDGDDWLLTGEHVFVSGRGKPGFLLGPMRTDSEAPRHRNLGYFMIPVPDWDPETGSTGLEGLTIKEQDLLNGHDQHNIILNDVRIAGDHLIGGDHQGWQVAGTTMESEHGGRGRAFPTDVPIENLIEYVKETKVDGGYLGGDPVLQQTTAEAVIDSHIQSLLVKRVYAMYQSREEISWESGVGNVHGRESTLRNERRIRDVYGMYSLLSSQDPSSPHGGRQEVNHRSRAGQNHAGGSTNIAKVVLARRIGVSRTREQAAPTPSTATGHGS
jgi:alkylation response protein AidB-like acyl-CoA dehydrogenase